MDTFKSHELVTQEDIDYEHSDGEVIEFYDESNSELEIELEIDPIEQKLISSYPFWLNKENKIKEMEVGKIINTKSYQKAQLCVRQVIIRELERQLMQEWREQKGRYNPKILDYKSEKETKNLDFLIENEKNNDNSTTKNEKEKLEKRIA